jgi:hypothetical protein
VEKPKTEKQIDNMRKKALMEKLMKTKEWGLVLFVATLENLLKIIWGSNENTVINFPT